MDAYLCKYCALNGHEILKQNVQELVILPHFCERHAPLCPHLQHFYDLPHRLGALSHSSSSLLLQQVMLVVANVYRDRLVLLVVPVPVPELVLQGLDAVGLVWWGRRGPAAASRPGGCYGTSRRRVVLRAHRCTTRVSITAGRSRGVVLVDGPHRARAAL